MELKSIYIAGLKIPEHLDGGVIEAFEPGHFEDQPIGTMPALSSGERDESSPYSEEEEAVIEESLRGLGYL